jgi:hypothetical protein
MPQNKDRKRLVRARMAETGEQYTQALAHLTERADLGPLPPAWHLTGSRAPDYEVGLLPETTTCDGHPVVQLRLRATVGEPTGFGALMQSIAATRYTGRRVRFSGMVAAREVTGWGGLWFRIDGPEGRTRQIDNMHDRALRQSTGWTLAEVVLDVPDDATELHFGALLSGGGALELSQPRFEETTDAIPTTGVLPDEPQALDFGVSR